MKILRESSTSIPNKITYSKRSGTYTAYLDTKDVSTAIKSFLGNGARCRTHSGAIRYSVDEQSNKIPSSMYVTSYITQPIAKFRLDSEISPNIAEYISNIPEVKKRLNGRTINKIPDWNVNRLSEGQEYTIFAWGFVHFECSWPQDKYDSNNIMKFANTGIRNNYSLVIGSKSLAPGSTDDYISLRVSDEDQLTEEWLTDAQVESIMEDYIEDQVIPYLLT